MEKKAYEIDCVSEGLFGDPSIYKLLIESGKFPREKISGYDCKARAFAAARHLYLATGRLSGIYSVYFPERNRYHMYLDFDDKVYNYPILWHDRSFPEISLEKLHNDSWSGDVSLQLFADVWFSLTHDSKIWEIIPQTNTKLSKPYKPGTLTTTFGETPTSSNTWRKFLELCMDMVVKMADRDNLPYKDMELLRVLRGIHRIEYRLVEPDFEGRSI